MTHVFPFYGDIHQCWEVFYSEYHRLSKVLGQPPFEFETPKHSTIHEYVPKNGDEIIIYFWDKDHKHELLVVEAEIVPDEDRQYTIFVHPQGGNSFEEPLKSAISIWKEVKNALKKAEKRRVIKTFKHKSQKRYSSLRKMLEKIADRDDQIAENNDVVAWSLVVEGAISERTANEINKDVGGLIKEQWDHTNVPGEVFANLIFEKYKHFPNLKAEWNKLKGRDI